MKVLIYGRVSTGTQNVDRQISELQEFCKTRNYEVAEVFTETVSGIKKRSQRKELNKLSLYLEGKTDIKGVLVWELSRLGRNTGDVLEIINELKEKRIWVYSKKENLYTLNEDGTESPTTTLTVTVLSAVASLERDTILTRSRSGLRTSIIQGNWTGGAFMPYGYKRENKKIVIDEVESEIVKRIFQLYLKGNGTQKLCNILNKEKVPTRYNLMLKEPITINEIERKPSDFTWKDGTVYKILTNTVYIGKKEGKKNLSGLVLNSPAFIDESVFYEVQEKLKTSSKIHAHKFFYLFEGKLKCGICNRSYYPHKRITNTDNRYVCLSKRYKEFCDNIGISIPKLNDGVWSLLRNNKRELSNILELNTSKEELKQEIAQLLSDKKDIEENIKKVGVRQMRMLEMYSEGKTVKEHYNLLFESSELEKNKYQNELDEINSQIEYKRNLERKQDDFTKQLKGIKDDKHLLKKTINNVVNKIVLYPIVSHDIKVNLNKQDKFIFVEVFTYISDKKPLCFSISQRSNIILYCDSSNYDKETKRFKISKDLRVKQLFHLKSLD